MSREEYVARYINSLSRLYEHGEITRTEYTQQMQSISSLYKMGQISDQADSRATKIERISRRMISNTFIIVAFSIFVGVAIMHNIFDVVPAIAVLIVGNIISSMIQIRLVGKRDDDD